MTFPGFADGTQEIVQVSAEAGRSCTLAGQLEDTVSGDFIAQVLCTDLAGTPLAGLFDITVTA